MDRGVSRPAGGPQSGRGIVAGTELCRAEVGGAGRPGELDYRSVGSTLRYLEEALQQDALLRRFMSQAEGQIKNKQI